MKRSPSVDVIVPTYNGLPYLKEAVKSVLSQTYRTLNLYIVDDGSTDNTKAYVSTIIDPRVKYIHKRNGGQATARNLGIRKSRSPYLAFIDSDDIWYPYKLAKQLALVQYNPKLGMVYGHHNIIDEYGQVTGELRHRLRGLIFDDLLGGNFISGSGSMVLVKREVFDKVGLFREDFLIGEDWEMWLRIAEKYQIDFVDDILAALRVRSTGMQQDYAKMARGLRYMLGQMLAEFKLNQEQKEKLIFTCLSDAADNYYRLYDRHKSRLTLAELFFRAPGTIFYSRKWPFYLRTFLGRDSLIFRARAKVRRFLLRYIIKGRVKVELKRFLRSLRK